VAKRPHLKRVVVAVDGPEGVYGAADLHQAVHYQIGLQELEEFHDDLVRLNLPLHNAEGFVPQSGCSVLFLPDASNVLRDGSGLPEYFSLGAADFCDTAFGNLAATLAPKKIFRFLCGLSADSFDGDRGNLCLNFGWQAMNAVDMSREDLCGFSAPTLSNASGEGWSGSRQADLAGVMAAMTQITDHTTHVLGVSSIFGAKDDPRAVQYAVKIHPDNRAESITLSLSAVGNDKYLLAHVDHLNDVEQGYQYNVSYYGYHPVQNSSKLRRMHIGIYSRRVCGTTSHRSSKARDLFDDLVSFLDALPRELLEYSPEAVVDGVDLWVNEESAGPLAAGNGKGSQVLGEEIGRRRVHANKFVMYSAYASTLLEWIGERSKAGKTVSVPEIVDAVFSTTLTPSPRSWRRVFRSVTDELGVQLNGGARLPHYQHKLPLAAQFMIKSLELNHGSVGGGSWRRFQPSLSNNVEVEKVVNSLKNLLSLIEEVNGTTRQLRDDGLHDSDCDDELAKVSRSAVEVMKRSVANGGLHGVGELHAHHVLSILSLLGIVEDPVHSLNASISQGTDTARFLSREYSITTPSHFKSLMRFLSKQSFGKHGKLSPCLIENLICELGRRSKDVLAERPKDVYLWCDFVYRNMRFFDVVGGVVVAKVSGSVGRAVVSLRVASHCLSAKQENEETSTWKKSLSRPDATVSFLILDEPREGPKSKRNTFAVANYPWWKKDWVFTDDNVPVLVVKDAAEKKRHAILVRNTAGKKRKSADAGKPKVRVSVGAGKVWRATPPKDFSQKKKYRNLAAEIMWKLSELVAETDIKIAAGTHCDKWRRCLEGIGAEACIDIAGVPMTNVEREDFIAKSEHLIGKPDDFGDPFVRAVHQVATGRRGGIVAPQTRSRSRLPTCKGNGSDSDADAKAHSDADDAADETYDALADGGFSTNSYFHLDGMLFLRYGFYMCLSPSHSSTVDHIGMVSSALGMSGLSSRNFLVEASGRHYSCSLEYELDGRKFVHKSDEAVFGKSGCRTHLRVGAIKSGNQVLFRTKQHAQFAAAAVALQKLEPFWFEEKYLSSDSFHILFPSNGRHDEAYGYTTRGELLRRSLRCDPIAFLCRRNGFTMILDASAMEEKDRMETHGADPNLGKWCEAEQKRYSLHTHREIRHDSFVEMPRDEQLDRRDRYAGDDEQLLTYLSQSAITSFNLDKAITVNARKILSDGQHPFLPKGWCVAETVRRSGDSAGQKDMYFFSPRGFKFRSRVEVERYRRCQKSVGGRNEVMAWQAFDRGRCRINEEGKPPGRKRQKMA